MCKRPQDNIIKGKMDITLKQQKLNGGAIKDLLNKEPLKPLFDKFEHELDDEGCGKPAASPTKAKLDIDDVLVEMQADDLDMDKTVTQKNLQPWVEYG